MKEEHISFLLSFVAGFVDTAGFIALGGLFTAHVTGNLVLAGASIIQGTQTGILSRLLMIPVFMIAVAFTTVLARVARQKNIPVVPTLLISQICALILFLAAGVILMLQQPRLNETDIIAIGACGVLAMGIQNALMREGLSTLLPTTVMTGNLTQYTIDLTRLINEYLYRKEHGGTEVASLTKKVKRYTLVLAGFLLGAVGGAYGIAVSRFWCILVPIALTTVLVVDAFRKSMLSKEQESEEELKLA